MTLSYRKFKHSHDLDTSHVMFHTTNLFTCTPFSNFPNVFLFFSYFLMPFFPHIGFYLHMIHLLSHMINACCFFTQKPCVFFMRHVWKTWSHVKHLLFYCKCNRSQLYATGSTDLSVSISFFFSLRWTASGLTSVSSFLLFFFSPGCPLCLVFRGHRSRFFKVLRWV